jgi:dTDP-4-dehydrorhamnose reductase
MDLYRSILITGGGGMLAGALVDALLARGLQPVALKRADCDITDADSVAKIFERYRPSLLFNCAAHTAVDLCESEPAKANLINGEGPGNLARLARDYQTKLVHYSTDFVFDGQSDRPYRPTDPTNPLSVYGSSKLLGEQRVQQYLGGEALIVRTAWLFGRHGNCFPQTMLTHAKAGRRLSVVNDQVGSPTSTTDLAAATLHLLDAQARGIFHLANTGHTTWFDFAATTLQCFGMDSSVNPITTADWVKLRPGQAKRPAYSVLDTQAYNGLTGRQMPSWKQALQAYRAEQASKV